MKNNLKLLFVSLGCDKNLVDTEFMLGMLRDDGIEMTDDEQEADIIIVNTCCFINDAKEESINTILEMAELKKEARLKSLIVTGCLAQRYKEEIVKELEKNNIKVLFNSNVCFEKFCIAGVDDMQTGNPDIKKALKNIKEPVILLSHTPDIITDVPHSVNLTLAGHLHGGQIRLPQAIVVPSKFGKKFANGYYEYKGKKIYTTYGLGTSILPMRFNCLPEIAVIEFN